MEYLSKALFQLHKVSFSSSSPCAAAGCSSLVAFPYSRRILPPAGDLASVIFSGRASFSRWVGTVARWPVHFGKQAVRAGTDPERND